LEVEVKIGYLDLQPTSSTAFPIPRFQVMQMKMTVIAERRSTVCKAMLP